MSDPNDPMNEIRASFFIECEELMESLQDGLQIMDDGEDDAETINIVFRAVHSIKGGAGAFGLTELVRFAHRYETVLDEVRAGRLSADGDALKVFFQAADHVADLIRISRDEGQIPDEKTAELLALLDGYLGDTPVEEEEEEIEFQPAGISLDLDFDSDLPPLDIEPIEASGGPQTYKIDFSPQIEMFETGNEPFLLLRNLQELGPASIYCDTTDLPDAGSFSPDASYLNWVVELETNADHDEIASIFEFVEGLCTLSITKTETKNSALPEITEPQNIKELPEPEILTTASESTATHPAPDDEKKTEPTPEKMSKTTKAPAAKTVVRVDLDRIERLVNLVGELVINQAMLGQSLEEAGISPHSDAMNGLDEFQRLTRDIQDSVMMIRAQPVKSLFQRMSRIVREASSEVNKDVRLITDGETTEVDKTVIERLADPLTHMIRNAVDHGLENTEDRVAAGKPKQGQVNLSAAHRSGRVVIEVADDGGGINRPKVLQIAIDKGLVPADANLSDSEIDNLLFLPGFSTASKISDLSGRGVGMDVVRTAIQNLGGRITITSHPGEGTTFSISLPLTLAVLDGMLIKVADETLVLPLNVVIETLTLEATNVEYISAYSRVVKIRGEFVPLVDLGYELGYRDASSSAEQSVALLIAYDDDQRAAVMIDNIIDQRQVVIKGLEESFYRAPGIAAATILGDGQIALILDPNDIIANAQGKITAPQQQIQKEA